MAGKKQASRPRRKPLKPIGKTRFWAGAGWQERKSILRFSENLVNQCFEHLHQWQEKQACGRQRLTTKSAGTPSKTLGNKVLAHGHTGGNGGLPRSHLRNLWNLMV